MTINAFKLSYTQINPNANPFQLDADAERKFDRFFSSIFHRIFLGVFMIFDVDRNGKSNDEVFFSISRFCSGVLTFDEFLAAYIQMQRGKNFDSMKKLDSIDVRLGLV